MIPRLNLKAINISLLIAWLWAILFVLSYAWPSISSLPIPFAGMEKFSKGIYPHAFLQTSLVVASTLFISIQKIQTRDRLLIFQGMCFVIMFIGFFSYGMNLGLAFSCFSGIARVLANTKSEVTCA